MRDYLYYYQYHNQHRALESRFYGQNEKQTQVTMLNTQKKKEKKTREVRYYAHNK